MWLLLVISAFEEERAGFARLSCFGSANAAVFMGMTATAGRKSKSWRRKYYKDIT